MRPVRRSRIAVGLATFTIIGGGTAVLAPAAFSWDETVSIVRTCEFTTLTYTNDDKVTHVITVKVNDWESQPVIVLPGTTVQVELPTWLPEGMEGEITQKYTGNKKGSDTVTFTVPPHPTNCDEPAPPTSTVPVTVAIPVPIPSQAPGNPPAVCPVPNLKAGTVGRTTVRSGRVVTFRYVVVAKRGGTAAKNVTARITLPKGFRVIGKPNSLKRSGKQLVAKFATLPAGKNRVFSVKMRSIKGVAIKTATTMRVTAECGPAMAAQRGVTIVTVQRAPVPTL